MNMKPLTEFCTLNMGQSPDSKTYNDRGVGIPFYQGNADFGDIYPQTRVWCSSPTKIAEDGDILISVRAPIGAMNMAIECCCIGRGLAALTPKHGKCSKQFLFYALQSRVDSLIAQGTGSTFKAISKKVLEQTPIPVYSITEQEQIVDRISCVDFAIAERKKQTILLDQLVKSRFIEMFGEPDTNPLQWKEVALGEHLEIIGGYAFKSDGFMEEGIPVLRIGNINSGHFLPVNMVYWHEEPTLKRYKLYPGDLVMSLTGTVGKDDYGNVCILGYEYPEYYLNQRNAKLELKGTLNKRYLAEMLKFSQIKKRLTGISRGVRQANISNKDIINLKIPIPPIDLQKQFASFVEQADKSKSAVQKGLQELETLKKSLMQQYFG